MSINEGLMTGRRSSLADLDALSAIQHRAFRGEL